MTKLQNINANNVIRYDSKSTNKYYWVLDQVILETLEEDFNSLSREEFYNSFQNVSQNVNFFRKEEINDTTKYIPTFIETPIIKLNNENKAEFEYSLYENGKELLPRVNEHIDFISEQHYRINSIIKQYNDIKDFYWSILDNKIVKPEEIVFVYNWVASPQVNNVIQSLHLDYIIDTKWNNNPYIFPSFIKI
ncbi:MAG: hypothetical protein K2I49_02485 [Ureaplasma sp.]|nr:hypothetical protein [Ureaplasma sp.]